MSYLAVSGGGDNGAFGAGLMNGWTETGTRPEFKMVTGISTGALIAPFAFLGPDYDAALREVYTSMTPEKVFRARGLLAALFDDAMADTSPLAQVIAGYANQKMFDAIAREYQKGRLLMIGTTDLDAPAAGDLEHRRDRGQRPSRARWSCSARSCAPRRRSPAPSRR